MSEAARQSLEPADAQAGTSVLSGDDQQALRHAVATLENQSLVARFSNFAGRPVELIGHVLPRAASKIIARASRAALRSALRLALTTLPNVPAKRGRLIHKVRLPHRCARRRGRDREPPARVADCDNPHSPFHR